MASGPRGRRGRRPVDAGRRGIVGYAVPLVEERIGGDGSDFISVLADGETRGVFTRHQVLANTGLLLFAGHETTMNLICNGLLAFIRHPDQWERLRADPARGWRGRPPKSACATTVGSEGPRGRQPGSHSRGGRELPHGRHRRQRPRHRRDPLSVSAPDKSPRTVTVLDFARRKKAGERIVMIWG